MAMSELMEIDLSMYFHDTGTVKVLLAAPTDKVNELATAPIGTEITFKVSGRERRVVER